MGIARQFERVRGSYGAKLAVALLVVVAIAVGVGAMVYQQTNDQLQDDVRSELSATADARAAQLDAFLDNVRGQTRLASSRPVLASGDSEQISSFLDELAASESLPDGVVAVHYYDAASQQIVESSSDELTGVNAGEQGAAFATDPPEFEGTGDVAVTAPFEVGVVDFPVVAVLSPVDGAPDKRLVYMVNVNQLTSGFDEVVDGSDTVVVNSQGTNVAHTDASKVLGSHEGSEMMLERSLSESTFMNDGQTVMAAAPVEGADWAVMVHAPASQAFALGDYVASSVVGLILLTVVSLALVGVTLGSTTVISLRQLSARADEMADGNLDTTIETNRNDEFGTLAGSFRRMRDSLSESLSEAEAAKADAEAAREDAEAQREEAEQARQSAQETARELEAAAADYDDAMNAVADGDLTRRVDADRGHDAMARVGRSLNAMLDDIEDSVAAASSFADHVSTAAASVDDGATDAMDASANVSGAVDEISDGATEQTERLHEVAGEVDDLSASAEEVAETVASLADTAGQAADAVEDGQDAADDAVATMDEVAAEAEDAAAAMDALDGEMDDLGEVVDVIADIAEQTNLLALNASIEAARTGAEGDGFAVVADEVKGLAEESHAAAQDVEDRLLDLQEQVSDVADEMRETSQYVADGRETVDETAAALDDVVEFVAQTDSAAGEIREATDRQAEAASRVASAVDEVASISEETAAQSTDVADAADEQTETLSEVGDAAADLAERAVTLEDLLADFDARGEEEVN
ncbi:MULTISPECIES: methyl-accepting chemotaxis protein [Halobacterium]|uniref:methyl-accepting chemotaxis protein n=1 Tax=Halobacterium TaxID=2239 RepID=UPI00073F152E|nr:MULTISPECIES: methyl-accepting chemotaxis protein [Halobacterium]MCG1003893.1 methyl-accepting chemotaxis protein [Halobacterium noricense]